MDRAASKAPTRGVRTRRGVIGHDAYENYRDASCRFRRPRA